MSEPLVVIGNGMAAVHLVDELARRALGRYAIAVIGEEPRLAYNRVLLSAVLAREVSRSDIELRSARWWSQRGVTLLYGRTVTAIDPEIRRVRLVDGATLPYGKLILATGSRPIRLGVPGVDLAGVMTFRDLAGLAKAGAQVTIVHLMDRVMERQLDSHAAGLLKKAIEARGITVLLDSETVAVVGKMRVQAVTLKNGVQIEADLVVVAAGIRPNIELARGAGLSVDRGILVDDNLQTSRPGIYAIGECAEHRGVCYGLVEPAYEQARVLAAHLTGEGEHYTGSVLATNLKVSGVNVFSAGDFIGASGTEQLVFSDLGLGIYKKLVISKGRLVGAVLFGDTADGLWYVDLIRRGSSIGAMRDDIIFGRALAERKAA